MGVVLDLSQLAIEIRPRRPWEAIDLGVLMARRWWWSLTKLWLLLVAPLFLMLAFLPIEWLWLQYGLLWWLKPVFERALLDFLSRSVFGDEPTTLRVFKNFTRLAFTQCIASLTWRRLSPSRSFDLPVMQLEGLSGGARSTRLAILRRDGRGPANFLTMFGASIEMCIALAIIGAAFMFIPNEFGLSWDMLYYEQSYYWIILLVNGLAFVAAALIAPFYVASGFALYLNRRIHLEGWDIEIAFKNIVSKREQKDSQLSPTKSASMKVLAVFVLLLTLPALYSPETLAEETPAVTFSQADARALIDEVKRGEEFNRREVITSRTFPWDFDVDELPENSENPFKDFLWLKDLFVLIVQFAEFILWAVVIGLALFFIFKYRHWLQSFVHYSPSIKRKKAPSVLFGMEVTQESLPDNVGEEAQALWEKGEKRQALSLLYRACLVQLIIGGTELRDGDTEGLCLRKAKNSYQDQHLSSDAIGYFEGLTTVWQRFAYGHLLPESSAVIALCQNWQAIWRVTSDGSSAKGNLNENR